MTDQDLARNATQFLVDSAARIAGARGELTEAENMLRVTKSVAMKASGESAVSAQEREAYASDQYLAAVQRVTGATIAFEELRAKREAAKMRIEYWRSLNANQRAAERGYGAA